MNLEHLFDDPPEPDLEALLPDPVAAGGRFGFTFDRAEGGQLGFLRGKAAAAFALQPRLAELERLLLAEAGYAVVFHSDEPDLDALLEHGRLFEGHPVELTAGVPRQCHFNVATLRRESGDQLQVATGYALSSDGLWRQHSWAIYRDTILETTVPRLLYFGVILEGEALEQFLAGELYAPVLEFHEPVFDRSAATAEPIEEPLSPAEFAERQRQQALLKEARNLDSMLVVDEVSRDDFDRIIERVRELAEQAPAFAEQFERLISRLIAERDERTADPDEL